MRRLAVLVASFGVAAAVAAPAASAHQVECGDTITRDTTLQADLFCGAGERALTIDADRVTLDLGGHQVFGEILVDGRDRVTVRNGEVLSLVLRHAGRGRVLDLDIGEGGLRLEDSHRNVIRGNTIVSIFGAILLFSSDRNLIAGNEVQGVQNLGVSIDERSDRNFLVANRISASQADGVLVSGSRNTLFANDVTAGGGFDPSAIVIAAGVRNQVLHNDASANPFGVDAIFVGAAATRTLVAGNLAHDSGDDGIDVESATTRLRRNSANDNGDLGIEAVPGLRGARGNTAEGNGNPLQCLNVVCG